MSVAGMEKLAHFQMMLVNLRDDYTLGRRTQIDADAKSLQDAWKDLTDKQKQECKERTLKLILLFIKHLPGVGGNEFLDDYRQAFHEEAAPEPQQFSAMRIFKEMLAELEGME